LSEKPLCRELALQTLEGEQVPAEADALDRRRSQAELAL